MRTIWIYVEVLWTKLLLFFGKRKDASVIPEGHYCYLFDGRTGFMPDGRSWLGTKPCPYYRGMKGELDAACTFVGFVGFDMCLGDQCKICGENYGKESDII